MIADFEIRPFVEHQRDHYHELLPLPLLASYNVRNEAIRFTSAQEWPDDLDVVDAVARIIAHESVHAVLHQEVNAMVSRQYDQLLTEQYGCYEMESVLREPGEYEQWVQRNY